MATRVRSSMYYMGVFSECVFYSDQNTKWQMPVNKPPPLLQELAECMTSLKLSKYINQFQEHMVDGAILKELDAELLKSDFGFSGIEAVRLMKFAKEGHIPK